ncbi:MAG: acyl carrier protein [Betaproteobacteria bacterium]|nr:MAG: acyl carrier protein [Betaproteobacteria bacterium]
MDPTLVRASIADVLASIAPEVELSTIDAAAPLRDQIDLDSMDYLNFIVGLHERLHVDIPESDYARLVTLEDLVSYLAAKRPG